MAGMARATGRPSLRLAVDLHLKSEIAPVLGHAGSKSFAGAIFVGA